jgi:hypothetical protein
VTGFPDRAGGEMAAADSVPGTHAPRFRAAAGAVPGIMGSVDAAAFLSQFIPGWLGVWLVADGAMRVPLIRWRFQGGRLV